MKNYIFITFVILSVLSCQSSVESSEQDEGVSEISEQITDLIDTSQNTEVSSQNEISIHANSWQDFKESISTENKVDLQSFFSEDAELDAQNVLDLCKVDWVCKIMSSTKYEDLTDSDLDGTAVKEFIAEDIVFEDGEEYGSGIYLYFKEETNGLKLLKIVAAG